MAWPLRQKLTGARPLFANLWSAHEHRGSCPFHQAGLTCDRQISQISYRFPGARSFSSTPFDSAQEREVKPFSSNSGFWREGLPSPEEMKDGKWMGKGRSLVWCQVVEEAQTRRKPPPKAGFRPARPDEFDSSSAGAWGAHSTGDDSQQFKGWTSSGFTGPGGRIWGNGGARPTFFTNNAWNRIPCQHGKKHHHHGRRCGSRMSMKERHFQRAIRMRTVKGDPAMFKNGLFYFLVVKPRVPKTAPKYRRSVLYDYSRYSTSKTPFAALAPSLPPPPPSFAAARPSIFRTTRTPFPTAPKPIPGALQIRGFASSCRVACIPCVEAVPRAVMQAGIPVLVPLLGLLKSTAAINITMIISRIALTALPLSLRAKFIYALRERYLRDPENASNWLRRLIKSHHPSGEVVNGRVMRVNARWIVPTLLFAPVLLTIAIIAASFERTPVTGRLRVMMLSPTEEADLVSSILTVGESSRSPSRDWVEILRSVLELEDEGYSPTTGRRLLLGGEVLDERDWRVRWTEAVLRRLETGVPMLATAEGAAGAAQQQEALLRPPPTRYPLAPRTTVAAAHELGANGSLYMGKHRDGSVGQPTAGELACEYHLLVIERDEPNAFSFGFGPDHVDEGFDSKGRRGVVVVYTGFIKEILGEAAPISAPPTPPDSPRSSSMFNFLGRESKPAPLPNLEPTILPSREQTQALAVLLSHELAHLVLSHTLESYASTSLLIPHLTKLGSDVLRTLVYPITALLGPFVNDALGRSMNEGASAGFGVVGQVFNSCSSRTLEIEADLVALRLLSYSGIDPRFALDFWEDRLAASITPHSTSHPLPPAPPSSHLRLHSASHALPSHNMSAPDGDQDGSSKACKFLRSHPVDEERVQRIRDELVKWVSFRGTEFAV